jgi:hypothetical protein
LSGSLVDPMRAVIRTPIFTLLHRYVGGEGVGALDAVQ